MYKILVILLFLPELALSQNPKAKEALFKMQKAMDNVKTAKYVFYKVEMIGNELKENELIVKLQNNPLKIYVQRIRPNPGAEALWVSGENDGKVLVNPNRFPYINLYLSPESSWLMVNQHYTILELGFSYFASVLKKSIEKTGDIFYSYLNFEENAEWKGKKYFKLTLDNKNFQYIPYVVQKGETFSSIAKKFYINKYMILAANDRQTLHITEGEKILIPNAFAKKVELYLDKTTFLPFIQIIYDNKGLFEHYEISSFILNPYIDPVEFTPDYEDYDF